MDVVCSYYDDKISRKALNNVTPISALWSSIKDIPKDERGAITVSSSSLVRNRKACLEHLNGLLCYDYDNVDIDYFKSELESTEGWYAAFTSPSGNGVKVIVDARKNLPELRNSFKETYHSLAPLPGHDEACSDPSRLCFVTTQSSVVFGKEGQSVKPEEVYSGAYFNQLSDKDKEFVGALNERFYDEDARNNSLVKASGYCGSLNIKSHRIKTLLLALNETFSSPLPSEEVIEITTVWGDTDNDNFTGVVGDRDFEHFIAGVKAHPDGIAWDDLGMRYIYFPKNVKDDWEVADDRFFNSLLVWMRQNLYYKTNDDSLRRWDIPKERFYDFLDAMVVNNSVETFSHIRHLISKSGDAQVSDEKEFYQWAFGKDTFNFEESALNKWAIEYIVCGVIARCYDPGCLLRVLPILVGTQGIGKSTLLTHIFSLRRTIEESLVCTSLRLSDDYKARAEKIRGCIYAEVGEIDMKETSVNDLKSFITIKIDMYREAYGHFKSIQPRTALLVGTANEDFKLPDDVTGSTRFVVLESLNRAGFHVEGYFTPERQNAILRYGLNLYHRYPKEYWTRVPPSLMKEQRLVNESYSDISPELLDAIGKINRNTEYNFESIAKQINNILSLGSVAKVYDPSHPKDSSVISKALNHADWTRVNKRFGSKRMRVWRYVGEDKDGIS